MKSEPNIIVIQKTKKDQFVELGFLVLFDDVTEGMTSFILCNYACNYDLSCTIKIHTKICCVMNYAA